MGVISHPTLADLATGGESVSLVFHGSAFAALDAASGAVLVEYDASLSGLGLLLPPVQR